MQVFYVLNIDRNARDNNRLTIFVNYRMFESAQYLVGATGVGIYYNSTQKIF